MKNKEVWTHTYTNPSDADCNLCGNVRDLSPENFDETFAKTGECYWELDGTTLFIFGEGKMGEYTASSPAPWSTAASTITKVVIEEGVTSIGGRAFADCTALTDITIPDSVIRIGARAFYNCEKLTNIVIPGRVPELFIETFYGCSDLTSIVIPKTLTNVVEKAFRGCNNLAHVYYEGSESDRTVITIGSSYNKNFSEIATWHYNACLKNEGVWTHEYDHSFDVDCNECGAVRIPEKSVNASLSLSVEERIYAKLWLDAEGVDAYKAEVGEFTYEAFVTIGGEKVCLGSGAVTGTPTVNEYGSHYIIRLSAYSANHFDKTIEIVTPIFTLNTLGDNPLNLLNVAKAGAEAGYDEKNTNLFKALYNYGASVIDGVEMVEMPDFVQDVAAAPVYQKGSADDIAFTSMSLLMGDAIGIRFKGTVVDPETVVTLTVNGEKTNSFKFDEETGTLDVYVNLEKVEEELTFIIYTDGAPAIAVKTSIKGYTEAVMNKGDAELAVAQLAQACANILGK